MGTVGFILPRAEQYDNFDFKSASLFFYAAAVGSFMPFPSIEHPPSMIEHPPSLSKRQQQQQQQQCLIPWRDLQGIFQLC